MANNPGESAGMSALTDLLRECSVQISVANSTGSGFLVASGRILTCAHVVESAHDQAEELWISRRGERIQAQLKAYAPAADLALLEIPDAGYPCVYLDAAVEIGDEFYAFGYPGATPGYGDYSEGDSLTVKYEGPSAAPFLLKLKHGQIVPGFSGSPLLNLRTGGVCGVLNLTRDERTDSGGRAIPVQTILTEFGGLAEAQDRCHRHHTRWTALLSGKRAGAAPMRKQIIHNHGKVEQQFNIDTVENLTVGK